MIGNRVINRAISSLCSDSLYNYKPEWSLLSSARMGCGVMTLSRFALAWWITGKHAVQELRRGIGDEGRLEREDVHGFTPARHLAVHPAPSSAAPVLVGPRGPSGATKCN